VNLELAYGRVFFIVIFLSIRVGFGAGSVPNPKGTQFVSSKNELLVGCGVETKIILGRRSVGCLGSMAITMRPYRSLWGNFDTCIVPY